MLLLSTALVWFRRDLRLADNPALRSALDAHEYVVPVYIHAPQEEKNWRPGGATRWWLHHSLAALGAKLRHAGAPLILRSGDSLAELRALARATGAQSVYWNRVYEPELIDRDKKIKQALRDDGFIAESSQAALCFEPWQLQTQGREPYRVFTPFWRNADAQLRQQLEEGRAPLPAVRSLKPAATQPESLALDALELLPKIHWDAGLHEAWTVGEGGAHARLEDFCKHAVAGYSANRDLPAVDGTSQLSPYLHFGEISPLQIAARCERLFAESHSAGVRKGGEHFLREVGWREFAHHLLYHFPQTPQRALNARFDAFPWRSPHEYAADLIAWRQGRTGVPLVDAGMRQLWATGWMHNRVRMIVGSFLTKNLLIPWQEGAAWFWDTLVDADLANNTLGWQWIAGCGADAAPYFRVFNPVLQSQKFDGSGAYLRRWLPELAGLPDAAIHAPWLAKPEVLRSVGFTLGQHYPQPIVDLAESRERALAAYQRIRSGD